MATNYKVESFEMATKRRENQIRNAKMDAINNGRSAVLYGACNEQNADWSS